MSETSKKPIGIIVHPNGTIEIMDPRFQEPSLEERAERKKFSTRCGHIKRRLNKNERLTGDLLEFALELIGVNENTPKEFVSITSKLETGEPLSEYEYHLMVDVLLVHARVA